MRRNRRLNNRRVFHKLRFFQTRPIFSFQFHVTSSHISGILKLFMLFKKSRDPQDVLQPSKCQKAIIWVYFMIKSPQKC